MKLSQIIVGLICVSIISFFSGFSLGKNYEEKNTQVKLHILKDKLRNEHKKEIEEIKNRHRKQTLNAALKAGIQQGHINECEKFLNNRAPTHY